MEINKDSVIDLLVDMVADENSYDVRRVITNDEFRETGKAIVLAKSWNLGSSIIDYDIKYGEDTLNYVLKLIQKRCDEKNLKEETNNGSSEAE